MNARAKKIYKYLEELGVDDITNSFLVDEFIEIEKIIEGFKKEMKVKGQLDAKGKLNGAFLGYNTMLGKKALFLEKLLMTVKDRQKIKKPKEDAIQLEFENFMRIAQ